MYVVPRNPMYVVNAARSFRFSPALTRTMRQTPNRLGYWSVVAIDVLVATLRSTWSASIRRKKLVPDKATGPYEFTDGCGMMSRDLARCGACLFKAQTHHRSAQWRAVRIAYVLCTLALCVRLVFKPNSLLCVLAR